MRAKCINRELTTEVIVGAFMMTVLLGLGYFTIILSRDAWFHKKHLIEVRFEDVMGLKAGDNVVCRGMPIGTVSSLEMRDDGVRVIASLSTPVTLYEDYTITVVTTSMLGGRNMQIDEGSRTAPELAALDLYEGAPPYNIIEDAAAVINGLRKGLIEDGTVDNLRIASEDLRNITGRINAGEGFLGKLLSTNDTLYADVAGTATSLRQITARLEEGKSTLGKLLSEDDQIYSDIAKTASSLRGIAERLESGESTLGKLVSDDAQVYHDLAAAVASVKVIAARLENGEGSMGLMLTDKTLYEEVTATVKEARDTLEDVRETSPVATFTTILFNAF